MSNYDYDTENESLTRRQRIIDALQTGSLAPINIPAAPGVKTGKAAAFEGLAKIGNQPN